MLGAASIENVAQESSFQIRSPERPVDDRRPYSHVDLHHEGVIMMRHMMPTRRIDDRQVPHQEIVINMTAEVNEFIEHIAGREGRHQEPPKVCRDNSASQ